MYLDCYKIHNISSEIVPGHSNRNWMDAFDQRHPYRCLPMTMANSTGWEILCPTDIKLQWNGGPYKEDLQVLPIGDQKDSIRFASSHFAQGIATFHTGYLFRTPPKWGIWVTGPPNWPKDGISPLTGLVETDWLPFPFTMNWKMTRPGDVIFEKGEPFAFLMPVEHKRLEEIQPEIKLLNEHEDLHNEYQAWSASRSDFNSRLRNRDESTVKKGWQRHYMRGENHIGENPQSHQTKRLLKVPKSS